MIDYKAISKSLKSFDWRSLKKFTSSKAADDLNIFLEKLPQNTSQTLIIIAATIWACGGALGLFTTVKLQAMTELRAQLQEAQALLPNVPTITNRAVDKAVVAEFVDKTAKIYNGLSIKPSGSSIIIDADSTTKFGEFREVMGHIQNGGETWRVNIDSLCVGRECKGRALSANLKINEIDIRPAT